MDPEDALAFNTNCFITAKRFCQPFFCRFLERFLERMQSRLVFLLDKSNVSSL